MSSCTSVAAWISSTHHGEVEVARADIARRAAREQRQRRAQPLAVALDGVGHVAFDRGIERARLLADALLDRVKLGVDQLEGRLERLGLVRGVFEVCETFH